MFQHLRWKQSLVVGVIGVVLAVGAAAPVLADKGGQPNQRSCGGIGREARTFAAMPGPMNPGELLAAQGPFTCDDVGEEHGQGF